MTSIGGPQNTWSRSLDHKNQMESFGNVLLTEGNAVDVNMLFALSIVAFSIIGAVGLILWLWPQILYTFLPSIWTKRRCSESRATLHIRSLGASLALIGLFSAILRLHYGLMYFASDRDFAWRQWEPFYAGLYLVVLGWATYAHPLVAARAGKTILWRLFASAEEIRPWIQRFGIIIATFGLLFISFFFLNLT